MLISSWSGSSPRRRGKLILFVCNTLQCRLIPAWAGKTCLVAHRSRRGRAHPRVGGENEESLRPRTFAGGSSPRGRGKPFHHSTTTSRHGLIPAWAGKTQETCPGRRTTGAHPRVGGENAMTWQATDLTAGSSPRGRGKHLVPCKEHISVGLIPAWAGKTLSNSSHILLLTAHPRVGGENWMPAQMDETICGSSPRGRGKPM